MLAPKFAFTIVGIIAAISIVLLSGQSRPADDTPFLLISGEGVNRTAISKSDFDACNRVTVSVTHKEQTSAYEGVRVSELLMRAGFKFGQNLRGPRLADCLVAADETGFRVVFALPEFDPEFSDRTIILADRCDGKPLAERDGPVRLVVSDERKHARWIRNVRTLTIARVQ